MRNDSLMNGGLIGFGVGFISASAALHRVVGEVIPQYATIWHFNGVIVIGVIGLVTGIGLEVFQRIRTKSRREGE
ncbi:hypothetical protein ACFLUJ_01980 [Chloroflexota bacterium]